MLHVGIVLCIFMDLLVMKIPAAWSCIVYGSYVSPHLCTIWFGIVPWSILAAFFLFVYIRAMENLISISGIVPMTWLCWRKFCVYSKNQFIPITAHLLRLGDYDFSSLMIRLFLRFIRDLAKRFFFWAAHIGLLELDPLRMLISQAHENCNHQSKPYYV